ncbi:ATP-binding protein [Streptomyces sp. NPDC007148]|uniref:ATP-binding protein n=1 Tax=unclassified Streptomyces TaxID=2593676 RepID=UPI00343C3F3F
MKVEDWAEIRRLHRAEGMPVKEIARRLGVARNTVRAALNSDLPFGRWGETFSDDVVAAAMIDRLVHHAEVLTLTGDSYRTRARRELLAKDRAGRE